MDAAAAVGAGAGAGGATRGGAARGGGGGGVGNGLSALERSTAVAPCERISRFFSIRLARPSRLSSLWLESSGACKADAGEGRVETSGCCC